MKILVILLLIFSILGGIGFGVYYTNNGPKDVYDIAESSKPTKITTEVSYVTFDGDSLTGFYVTKIHGNDTVFEYTYDRLRTPAEAVAEGTTDRIKTVSGVIYYHDGVFSSGDGGEWTPGAGAAFDLKLDLNERLLKDVEVSEDGNTVTAKLTAENAVKVIGTDLNAIDDIGIIIETNGINLTMVTITADTELGTLTIRTSYTYNDLGELFPETTLGE